MYIIINRYSTYQALKKIRQQDELIENLTILAIILFVLLLILTIRNWYNKKCFKTKNKHVAEQLKSNQLTIKSYEDKFKVTQNLEKRLIDKQLENNDLRKEVIEFKQKFLDGLNGLKKEKEELLVALSIKEKEIKNSNEQINYQRKAYERYVDFKNIEANSTRLGAHFIKNVISQIYTDIEDVDQSFKTFLGIKYKIGDSKSRMPPIRALKDIFRLLDYNVTALNKEHTSIKEELEYINMFLGIIRYLKPKAKIEFDNALNSQVSSTLKIKPTLFFPFVENALKHGSLNDDNSFIKIVLKESDYKQLSYCLINSAEQRIDQSNEINSSSFGLKSLQQMLNVYYPNSKLEHKTLPNNQYLSELILNLN